MDTSLVQTPVLRTRKFRNSQAAWKRLRAKLKPFEDQGKMQYNTVLGAGGFGLVQKWTTNQPKVQGRKPTVAIKTLVKPNHPNSVRSLMREIYWMKRFQGCEHLIQLTDLPEMLVPFPSSDINNENCSQGIPIIVMEELGCGSLYKIMCRIGDIKALNSTLTDEHIDDRVMEYIPNRILWGIFLCLVRGLIGIAYPPDDGLPETRKGQINRETMRGIPEDQEPARIVHSDIDVYNTFVAYAPDEETREDREHRWHPVVKIADYGCMLRWDNDWHYEVRKKSLWGKSRYKAPEQFDPDGNLGAHTNIYQIGNIMHDLITLQLIPNEFRSYAKRKISAGGSSESFMTFGWRLLESSSYKILTDWKNVDISLRVIIAGCMAQEPMWRPKLQHLENICTHRIQHLDEALRDLERGRPPRAPVFVPGDPKVDKLYEKRVPQGKVEPRELLEKFYNEYFVEEWEDVDKYANYWAKKTLETEKPDDDDEEPVLAGLSFGQLV
ncbi:kinase-like protein [Xylaria sp. FL1777]|nr:kinase-like protein [Xylaria sp. FL1777]